MTNMSSNTSGVVVEEDVDPEAYAIINTVASIVYFTTGLFVFAGNAALLIPILYHKAFRTRKEYIVLGGLAFADAWNGMAFFLAGCWRLPRSIIGGGGASNTLGFTSLHCGLMPFILLWDVVYAAAGLMLSVVSLDRFLVTAFTMWYISQGATLAYAMLAAVFVHQIVFTVAALVSGYLMHENGPVSTDLCYQSEVMHRTIYSWELKAFNYGHLGSIVIFAAALLVYARHNKKVAGNSEINAQAAKQQRDMTKRMAWSTVATFFLVILPVQAADYLSDWPSSLTIIFYLPNNFNPLINVFLFLIKHKLMWKGLKKALAGKNMPIHLKDWADQTTVATKMESPPAAADAKKQTVVTRHN